MIAIATELPPPPAPAPPAPDFPVTWDDPADARLAWTFDKVHWPDPMPPLVFAVAGAALARGLTRASQAQERPIAAIRVRHINTYRYQAIVPVEAPPEEVALYGVRAAGQLRADMGRLGERWSDEWMPEIQAHLAYWEGFDLAGAAPPALLSHLDATLERITRLWEIHFLLAAPMYAAIRQFGALYQEIFEGQSVLDAYRLLQGFPNKTMETGQALWQLSRRLPASPVVLAAFAGLPAAEVIPALERSPEGRAFLADLRAYLDAYGRRGDSWSLDTPSWIEDPRPVITSLKEYITQPDRPLLDELAVAAEEREALITTARARLQGYPRPVLHEFEFLLKAAQVATVLSEDHNFWIDFRSMYEVRRVFLECGRRLTAAGALDQPDDIFYLTIDEVRADLVRTGRRPRQALVAARRAEIAHFREVTPPPVLGTRPPQQGKHDALGRAWANFAGTEKPTGQEPGILRGTGGSPGCVRGPAKIVRSPADAGKLRPGDILVAPATTPSWTPLFVTAAAVVTDTGGILSHCAVVAREYRIPAVVGAPGATDLLADGQMVEVDGRSGLVRVVVPAS
jgi:pyruvate,water dikinase